MAKFKVEMIIEDNLYNEYGEREIADMKMDIMDALDDKEIDVSVDDIKIEKLED